MLSFGLGQSLKLDCEALWLWGGVGLVNTEKSEFREDDRLGYVHPPAPQVRGVFVEGNCAFCAAQFLWPEVFQSDYLSQVTEHTRLAVPYVTSAYHIEYGVFC